MEGVERTNGDDTAYHDAQPPTVTLVEDVYRSDLMAVRPTPFAGLGVFAASPIPAGTLLIRESPLVVPSELDDPTDLYLSLGALPATSTAPFWALSAYNRRAEEVQWIPDIRTRYTGPSASFDDYCDKVLRAWHIYETNRFAVRDAAGRRDRLGLFPASARLNHACRPNVFHRHNPRLGRLTIYALRDIQVGEELCTSYIDVVHATSERRRLLRHWGFKCACALCMSRDGMSDRRRAKLEGLFARVRLEAADREGREVGYRVYVKALGEIEEVLRLMAEEGLEECDTSAIALGLAAECAVQLGRKAVAKDWAEKALEVEERCLGRESFEWVAAKERLDIVLAMEDEQATDA